MADVFVGFLFDKEKELELLATSKRGVSTAPNQYQKGFLCGLGKKMQILSLMNFLTKILFVSFFSVPAPPARKRASLLQTGIILLLPKM